MRMDSGEVDRGLIGRDRLAKTTERIKRRGRADKLRGSRVKDRVGPVQDSIEKRRGYIGPGLGPLTLTVAKRRIVAPASVEQLVPFYADGT